MIRPVEPTTFLNQAAEVPVIDVRSPGEFTQGHIPGAWNIPVFSDSGRAEVGTLYVQSCREDAILKGLDLALPRTDEFLGAVEKLASPQKKLRVHCWRGGLRSALMAELFSIAGYDVYLLAGGYKAYRKYIREALARPAHVIVLGGYTGSGKTELLQAIATEGEQVIDLEKLACHKGSAFGALGQPAQPTTEQFENELYACWSQIDLSQRVWVEDESRTIGRVTMPDPMNEHITNGMLVRVELEKEERIARLVREYAGFDAALLKASVTRIADRLGGDKAKEALSAVETGQFDVVARIVLTYYDKAYQFSMNRRNSKDIRPVVISGSEMKKDAVRIIRTAEKNQ